MTGIKIIFNLTFKFLLKSKIIIYVFFYMFFNTIHIDAVSYILSSLTIRKKTNILFFTTPGDCSHPPNSKPYFNSSDNRFLWNHRSIVTLWFETIPKRNLVRHTSSPNLQSCFILVSWYSNRLCDCLENV